MNNSSIVISPMHNPPGNRRLAGIRCWYWLAGRRLLRHGQSRVMLLFFAIALWLGLLNKFGQHHVDALNLMIVAMGICYFPANLTWCLFNELSNVQAARLWSGLRISGWIGYALLGAVSIPLFVWLSYPTLPVALGALLGLVFYAGGLAPAFLVLTYLSLLVTSGLSSGVTFAKAPLSAFNVPTEFGLVGLAVLFIVHGLRAIHLRWRGDYTFKRLSPRGGPVRAILIRRPDRALSGWRRDRIAPRVIELAGALLFESGRRPPVAHRWKLICTTGFTFLIAIITAVLISNNQEANISGSLVAFVLAFALMGLTLLLAPFLGMQAPHGRLLPVSRHMFARATWLAHLLRSGHYLVLMGSLYTAFALLAHFAFTIRAMPTPQMAAALLTAVVPVMAMQQAAALKSDISTLVMNGRWNTTFKASLGRLLFNLSVMLVAGICTYAVLTVTSFAAAITALLAVMVAELWLIWRIHRHFTRKDLIIR